MLIHLENNNCTSTLAELDRLAATFPDWQHYVAAGCRTYLLTNRRDEQRPTLERRRADGRLACSDCDLTFATEAGGEQHVASPAHNPQVFRCPTCGNPFPVLSSLLRHAESVRCPESVRPGSVLADLLHFLHLRLSPFGEDFVNQIDQGYLIDGEIAPGLNAAPEAIGVPSPSQSSSTRYPTFAAGQSVRVKLPPAP